MIASKSSKKDHVAECHGVKVPDSPFLTEARIERIKGGRYEGQEIDGALEVVREGDRVLELGAGIGLVGAVVALNARPEKVMSFEANPMLIEHTRALYELNGLEDRIAVRNEVLISAPDAPETMTFHIHRSYLGSSLIDPGGRTKDRVEVPTASYAKVLKDFKPDVLLMDIEGGELDFLRHASLEGIRAIVIEFHPEAYGREGMIECKNILRRAGFAQVEDHCTRTVWTCRFDEALRPPQPSDAWTSEIVTLENAVVVPPAEQGFTQPAGVLSEKGAYQSTGALWRNGRALTTRPKMPKGDLPLREGTWLWGGVLWMHFGHFLVESTARLWALEHLGEKIDGVLFVPKRPRNGSEVTDFQRRLVAAMGTEADVACAGSPERVERLIVPGQGFGLGPMISGTDAFRKAMRDRLGKSITADGPEKLYISRSKLPAGRGNLIGETELEAHLSAEGYTIYHPQEHDIDHQIATYKAARKVIAAEGSALHLLAMVADHKTDVAMVVRRPSGATRNLQVHLESFMGKAPLTVSHLKRSWKPLGAAKARTWKGELDMPLVQDSLATAGFIGKGGKTWSGLDPETVQDQLGPKFEEVA
ncbi:FkbM family methyltransferase [Marimonas sp. MJW-29]|uniref:FkbM family methyltransferase n=1 Tax=Sulfitobacter sediminis TaxID=3234186 RepID=A0ABV3RHS4_9RHOB